MTLRRRRFGRFTAAAFTACVAAGALRPALAHGQPAGAGIRLSEVAGTWEATAMVGPRDSIVATYQINAAPSRSGWTVLLPGRPPLPARIVALGGDSVVFDLGPFESILRRGVMVTTRTTAHFTGDTMTGRIVARYSSGDTLLEKTTAIRQ